MGDEADRLNDACPTCGHALALHRPEGCTVTTCRCLQPFDADGHGQLELVLLVIAVVLLLAIWLGVAHP